MIYPGQYTIEYGQTGEAFQAVLCIKFQRT